jgi:DNA-binding MarR family transcriptional regulator
MNRPDKPPVATNNTIEIIVENLFYAIPVIHKKLMKIDPPDIKCGIRISRLHIGILALLSENTLPISEIAGTFLIPKPQMTYLMNQMVEAGLVEKMPNIHDRRIKDVILTPKGKETFQRCDEYLKNNVKVMLACLTEKELEELSISLRKLKEIGPKLGNRRK